MDAVQIANEAIDSRMSQKKPGILCKLECISLFCFWCTIVYSKETESIIEVLGSIQILVQLWGRFYFHSTYL